MLLKVIDDSEMKNGEIKKIDLKEAKFTMYKVKDEYYGTDNLCTHQEGILADGYLEDDYTIVCPQHGGKFDIRSGKCIGLPATEDICIYKLVKKDNEVFVEVDEVKGHACKKNCEHCNCGNKDK